MVLPIPRVRPKTSWFAVLRQLRSAEDVIERFEGRFAEFVGAKHAIAVSSGRAGLALILQALQLPAGSSVALAALNTPIVANVLVHGGWKPRFVDVAEEDGNLVPDDLPRAVDETTSAVLATHLEGTACNIDAIGRFARERSLPLIEDCAHACGTWIDGKHAGTFGVAGFFSFGLGKNLNAAGGGMVVTDDDVLARSIRTARGQNPSSVTGDVKRALKSCAAQAAFSPLVFPWMTYPVLCASLLGLGADPVVKAFEDSGADARAYGSDGSTGKRISRLSAAMGLGALASLEDRLEKKRRNAALYRQAMGPRVLNSPRNGQVPSVQECCLRSLDPDRVQKHLLRRGIDSQRTWMTACHLLPSFAEYHRDCPVAGRLATEILYLPNYPEMSPAAVGRVVRRLEALGE